MSNNQMTAYQLVRKHDSAIVMSAEYTKYYPQTPYCALFAQYPAEQTKVMVCRKVAENDTSCGKRLCRLVSYSQPNGETVIGYYVPLCEANSEKEATQKIISNMRGNAALHNALNASE